LEIGRDWQKKTLFLANIIGWNSQKEPPFSYWKLGGLAKKATFFLLEFGRIG
jgi:hypothetical protein